MTNSWLRQIRRLLPSSWKAALGRYANLPARVAAVEDGQRWIAARILRERYGPGEISRGPRESWLEPHELRVSSQNGEDGILLHLLSLVGSATRTAVEFGCGDGTEFNSLHLIRSWAWDAVLVEADREKAELAKARFAACAPGQRIEVLCETLDRDNVDEILVSALGGTEPDVLSIDVDGMDYWLWKAIRSLHPRIVIVEYNAALGSSRSITVPYQSGFDAYRAHPSGIYHGASLPALSKLADEKGYVLAGCESNGVNAFFVRRDLASLVPQSTPSEAYRPLSRRFTSQGTEERFARVEDLAFDEV